jgi:hypothetical protein
MRVIRVRKGGRAGIGTTLAYVLILLGIALLLILGSDSITRGSRMSLQKAQALAHINGIGVSVLDEVFLAPKNRSAIIDAVLQPISNLGPGAVPPVSAGGGPLQPLGLILQLIAPVKVGSNPPTIALHPAGTAASEDVMLGSSKTGMAWIPGKPNTVAFGTGGTDVVVAAVKAANQAEIDAGRLSIGTVRLKPVLYRYDGSPTIPGGHSGGGLARAQVQITYRPPRPNSGPPIVMNRTYIAERMFSLVLNEDQSAWTINVDTDPWRMEASDD